MALFQSASRFVMRSLVVVAGGACLGLAINGVAPKGLDLRKPIFATAEETSCESIRRITQVEAQSVCSACTAAFVDARNETAFAQGHILGAVHLPPHGHADESPIIARLQTYPMVVVYDDDVGCKIAEDVAKHLVKEDGLPDVRVLDGSWMAWQQSGGPAQSGACEVCSHPAAHEARRTP
jgi:3-mercaptopyruvate sulfurtransferase SseA